MTFVAASATTAERESNAKAIAARLSNKILFGGHLVACPAGESFPVENPARGETIGYAPRCGADLVDKAVSSAQAAFPAWSAMPARGAKPTHSARRPSAGRRG